MSDVAIYCLKTGTIRQVTSCTSQDADRQHEAHPEHGSLDVTGQRITPHDHAVDLETLTIVPRTRVNVADLALKRHELNDAFKREAAEADHTMMLRATLGDVEAQTELRDILRARETAVKKLAALLSAATNSTTRDELAAIKW